MPSEPDRLYCRRPLSEATHVDSRPVPADQPLYDLVNGAAPKTIAEVIARMQAIDALLPANDGLKLV